MLDDQNTLPPHLEKDRELAEKPPLTGRDATTSKAGEVSLNTTSPTTPDLTTQAFVTKQASTPEEFHTPQNFYASQTPDTSKVTYLQQEPSFDPASIDFETPLFLSIDNTPVTFLQPDVTPPSLDEIRRDDSLPALPLTQETFLQEAFAQEIAPQETVIQEDFIPSPQAVNIKPDELSFEEARTTIWTDIATESNKKEELAATIMAPIAADDSILPDNIMNDSMITAEIPADFDKDILDENIDFLFNFDSFLEIEQMSFPQNAPLSETQEMVSALTSSQEVVKIHAPMPQEAVHENAENLPHEKSPQPTDIAQELTNHQSHGHEEILDIDIEELLSPAIDIEPIVALDPLPVISPIDSMISGEVLATPPFEPTQDALPLEAFIDVLPSDVAELTAFLPDAPPLSIEAVTPLQVKEIIQPNEPEEATPALELQTLSTVPHEPITEMASAPLPTLVEKTPIINASPPVHQIDVQEDFSQYFSFIPLVLRLDQRYSDDPPIGSTLSPREERVRFEANPSLGFPVAEIARVEDIPSKTGGRPMTHVTTNMFGLFGPSSPLPPSMNERILNRENHNLANFIDFFNHRLTTLLFLTWKRYRHAFSYERGAVDPLSQSAAALFGGYGIEKQKNLPPLPSLLSVIGLLSLPSRSASIVAQIIRSTMGIECSIDEFVPHFFAIKQEERYILGTANCVLGVSTISGESMLSAANYFRVRLGPLTLKQFNLMLPGQERYKKLTKLISFAVDEPLGCLMRLELLPGEAKNMVLGVNSTLAWDTWISPAQDEISIVESFV